MNIERYNNWQEKLKNRIWFRYGAALFGIYSVLIIFAMGTYLLFVHRWQVVIVAFAAFAVGRLIISPVIYIFYKKARPYQTGKFIPISSRLMSLPTTKSNSFPSDHAVSFAAIATVWFYFIPVAGVIVIILMFLNGWMRIVLGYHDEYDVGGGWVIGIAAAIFVIKFITLWLGGFVN